MTTFAIPDDLAAELQVIADREGRPAEDYVRQAVANLLEDLEDVATVTERLKNGGRTIPLEEVVRRLGLDD